MKRNLVIVLCITGFIVLMVLLGCIETAGEYIVRLTKKEYMKSVWYGIVAILFFFFLLWPAIRVIFAPSIPVLNGSNYKSKKELEKFAHALVSHCAHIPNQEKRRMHAEMLKNELASSYGSHVKIEQLVQKELYRRIEGDSSLGIVGINQIIKDWGKSAFMATAICQNSKLDTIGMILLNYRMVTSIIKASGFRPSSGQLFKIYVKVLTTALLTYCISEALSEADNLIPVDFNVAPNGIDDDGTLAVSMVDGIFGMANFAIKLIPDIVKKSVLDGTANLLLTLRIGYVTRSYLTEGVENMSILEDRVKIRQIATYESLKNAMPIAKDGTMQIIDKVSNLVSNIGKV